MPMLTERPNANNNYYGHAELNLVICTV